MRRLLSFCLLLAVAACSTVGVNVTTPSPAPSGPVSSATGLDYLHDNVANLVLAIDLPQTVQFVATQSTLSFDVASTDLTIARHVKARLVRADADGVAGGLPALATGHIYYFFSIAESDKAAIREAQGNGVAHAVPPASVTLTLAPTFCAPHLVDATQVITTVRVALSGRSGLRPLVDRQTLAQVLARSGQSTMIAICSR